MGARNHKTVKGNKYLYYVTSVEGKKHTVYCGPLNNKNTEKKALELEITDLKKQKNTIEKKMIKATQKLTVIERRLK